ncbi:winged helix-turn-helix transcriptional regulator [Bradyrhizobium valentinum]|uniref:HxlR family transcriptional regulator n=1 Tax=Bradyrhizobium valentinum TaxID=1518501 RepID=A0A0R3LI91_9BRAD|nr:helix-turn-helix domain-containing protein [Bradyrhizobium valentinum]KRR05615.1 HxlR family transcriptional regulator [Bradyrhizobium valentinum]KRR08762.1 HxlR family transcriptional regulator [Bradyrhizobium valentinum]
MDDDQRIEADPHERCRALGAILDRIGDKWTVMAVGALSEGPMRFNALQRLIGAVSHRMLTLTLRGLERDGLVTRTIYPTIPPKVEYALTNLGQRLIPPLKTLSDWAVENQAELEMAQRAYDASAARSAPAS